MKQIKKVGYKYIVLLLNVRRKDNFKGLNVVYRNIPARGTHGSLCIADQTSCSPCPRKVWFREFPFFKISPIPVLGMIIFSVAGAACTQWLFILLAFPNGQW